jgi:carbon starvation protein CstA
MSALNLDSPSVQSYLGILQGVITRMATNSANAKAWCVALVSAIVVIIADKGRPEYVWISCVPIVLFFALDAYYLGLERLFRDVYNGFVRKLHEGTATGSFSIWPFYLLLIIMLLLVKAWVL